MKLSELKDKDGNPVWPELIEVPEGLGETRRWAFNKGIDCGKNRAYIDLGNKRLTVDVEALAEQIWDAEDGLDIPWSTATYLQRHAYLDQAAEVAANLSEIIRLEDADET